MLTYVENYDAIVELPEPIRVYFFIGNHSVSTLLPCRLYLHNSQKTEQNQHRKPLLLYYETISSLAFILVI